jgi:hypothetical protein
MDPTPTSEYIESLANWVQCPSRPLRHLTRLEQNPDYLALSSIMAATQ